MNHRTRFPRSLVLALLAAGCSPGGGGDGGSRLLALRLDVEGREDVARNQPIVLMFTTAVDPASVGLDTVQVRAGEAADPTVPGGPPPVLGRYEVRRNRVLFHPTVNPRDPNPLGLPLNPFGFDALSGYHVVLPAAEGARRLRSAGGEPLARSFTASFRTGAAWLPEVPAIPPRIVRAPDTNANPDDDLLTFDPPGPDPMDRRRELDSRVTISVTFTEPMDPASVNPEPASPSGPGGSFRIAETNLDRGIAGSIAWTPDGRTFTFTPAGGLGHATLVHDYLVTLTAGLRDLAGNAVVLEDVRPEELSFHTRLSPGESGPLLQTLLAFTAPDVDRDPELTDDDVAWGTMNPPPRDRLGPASIRTREVRVEPSCIPNPGICALFPQPLNVCDGPIPGQDCDPCTAEGPVEQGFSKGGRLQLLYFVNELRPPGGPQALDRLRDAETITRVEWGPVSNFLFRTRYTGVSVRMGHTTAGAISGLSLQYDLNYDDGSTPTELFSPGTYDVPERREATWFPWPQTRSFDFDGTRNLILEVNVPDPRSQDPQATYQLFRNQTRLFNPGVRAFGRADVPIAGCRDWTRYHHRFHLAKRKHPAVTRFLDVGQGTLLPLHAPPTAFPRPDQLPPGTGYAFRFQGAHSASGAGATAWSADVRIADRKRFLRLEVTFTSDARSLVRPWIDWIALGYTAGG